MRNENEIDGMIQRLRGMGCAVIVITPEDIQALTEEGDDDESPYTLEQIDEWMLMNATDLEEAIIGDYWGDTVRDVLNYNPIPGMEHVKCGYRILPREDFMMLEKLDCYTGATSMTSEQIDANERREAAVLKQRAQQYAGAYVLYDPEDDAEGFMLVGDDPIDLNDRAVQQHKEIHGG